MDRTSQKRKRILAAALVIAAFVLWLFFFLRVNGEYPPRADLVIAKGETLDAAVYRLTVTESGLYTPEELKSTFHTETDGFYGYSLVAKLLYENTSTEPQNPDLRLAAAQSGAWTNGIDYSLYLALNSELPQTLQPGETATVFLPFGCAKQLFQAKSWQSIRSRPFEIIFELYPKTVHLAL